MDEELSYCDRGEFEDSDREFKRNKWMSLPSSMRQLRTLYLKGERHPAMNMADIAIKMKRSPNQVFILLVGETGAGKSSTINYLFRTNIAETSDTSSQTKSTTEYTIKMRSEEWRIPDLTLSFVDSPGFEDSDGPEQDARNVLSIKNFFEQHPNISNTQKSRCYPNIVMIVLKITENRVKGKQSKFLKMLKGINIINVIDKSNPNLVVVLTHACSVGSAATKWQEEVDKKKLMIKSEVYAHLGVDPEVVVQENKPEHFELKQEEDWHLLPNGDKQPKILFVACKNLLNNIKDEIGHEAITVCFRNLTDKRVCEGFVIDTSKADEKEVEEMHLQLAKSVDMKYEFEDVETHRIWGLKSNIGQGFNIFTDSPTSISPLKLQIGVFGNIRISDCDFFEILCEKVKDDEQYKKQRLKRLNVPVDKRIKYDALSMKMRAGYNSTRFLSKTRNLSFSLEHRIGKVELHQPYELDTNFIKDVRDLPLRFNASDEDNLKKWEAFMGKWGSHIIVETYIGGFLSGDVKLERSQSEEFLVSTHDVHAALESKISSFLSGFESMSVEEITKLKGLLSSVSLSWIGGDPALYKNTLDDLNGNDWKDWIKSLELEPAPLCSILKLYPMYELVYNVYQIRGVEYEKAMDYALKGKVTRRQPPVVDNRITTATSNWSYGGCFYEDSMVMVSNGKQKRMKDLQTGDRILTVNDDGIITEDKVIAWLHRVETGRYNFLQLTHKSGEIRITQEHVVFCTKNQTPCQAVFLKPGDEMIMVKRNGGQDDFRICHVPILSIEKVDMTGLYAPLTYSGRLIVDGIAVSCYCKTRLIKIGGFDILSPHDIAHFSMMPMRIAHCLGIDINDGKMDKQTGIHQYAKWLMKMFLR